MTRSYLRLRRSNATASAARRQAARGDAGFILVESLGAIVIFVIVATSLAGVLLSAISSNNVSRERTIAQQEAQAQIEAIRRMPYDQVGIVGGNPPGTLPATSTVTRSGLTLTVKLAISYVGDNTPTSFESGADYKRVSVTVLRASDAKELVKEVTYVASPARAPLGGINNARINVQVVDYALNTPVEGATVSISSTAPSENRSDTTDDTGTVSFPALPPSTTDTDYYDITASLSGYVTLADDLPPASAAHHSLAPSETFTTTLRIYRPATINVLLKNADGTPFTGNATVTVSSSRGSEDFSYTGSALSITSIAGESVVPSLQYTVSAATSGGLVATPVTKYVPDDYPNVLETTFVLTFPQPSALVVTVTQLGVGVEGATVRVQSGSVDVSATTDASFSASFSAITPDTYTITASLGAATASTTATTTAGETTYVTIDLPIPPGEILATVTWGGLAVNGASVTLTGGPGLVNVTGTTNASGQVLFTNLPPGPGYTVTATATGQTGQVADLTVLPGQTTSTTVALPVGAVAVTYVWNGTPVAGAAITLAGGPMGINVAGVTDANGQVTFSNVPAGSGYTVSAPTGSASASVTAGSTTSVTITAPTGTLNVNVKRSGVNVSGATVVLVGGPLGITMTLTTNSSGNVSFTNVPTGSGYTLKAYKCSVSSPRSRQTTGITVTTGTNSVNMSFSTSTCPLP